MKLSSTQSRSHPHRPAAHILVALHIVGPPPLAGPRRVALPLEVVVRVPPRVRQLVPPDLRSEHGRGKAGRCWVVEVLRGLISCGPWAGHCMSPSCSSATLSPRTSWRSVCAGISSGSSGTPSAISWEMGQAGGARRGRKHQPTSKERREARRGTHRPYIQVSTCMAATNKNNLFYPAQLTGKSGGGPSMGCVAITLPSSSRATGTGAPPPRPPLPPLLPRPPRPDMLGSTTKGWVGPAHAARCYLRPAGKSRRRRQLEQAAASAALGVH